MQGPSRALAGMHLLLVHSFLQPYASDWRLERQGARLSKMWWKKDENSRKTKWKASRIFLEMAASLHASSIIFDPRVSQEARRAQRSRDVSSDHEVSERYGLPAGY